MLPVCLQGTSAGWPLMCPVYLSEYKGKFQFGDFIAFYSPHPKIHQGIKWSIKQIDIDADARTNMARGTKVVEFAEHI